MFKRLRWLIIGYILGVFTFDILKRYLDENYAENEAYQMFTSALASVSDFTNEKKNLEEYVESK